MLISDRNNLYSIIEILSINTKQCTHLSTRDVSRHITTLSVDDRESSQGPTGELVSHLVTCLRTGVEVKDITGWASRPAGGPLLVVEVTAAARSLENFTNRLM